MLAAVGQRLGVTMVVLDLAGEKILGGPRELELGNCKGTAAEAAWPWKSVGNVIVNVSVKQAQTQEAKRVRGGMGLVTAPL